MHTHRRLFARLLVGALAAAALMAASVSGSARNLSVNEKGLKLIFRTFTINFETRRIECNLTLLGRLVERTIAKIEGSSVGTWERVAIQAQPCVGGEVIPLIEALSPWTIKYASFMGRLPSITGVRLRTIGMAFGFRPTGSTNSCLIASESGETAPGEFILNIGTVERFRMDERISIRIGPEIICNALGRATFAGAATVRNLAQTSELTITLI